MALPTPLKGTHYEDRPIHPNQIIYLKMEGIAQKMLDETGGVPIKTVKAFLSKIPSVFSGADLIAWLVKNFPAEDLGLAEGTHMAHLLACHGYVFPIDDHVLTVKHDGTFYRFQTPYFWLSNCWEPENTDYAVYLCKRTMQNKAHMELEDFEAENLARLQKTFSRKWEFIFMQAEAQYKVDKKRDKMERLILDSQERAFWDVHRPVPGCVNTTEVDFRKLSRSGRRPFKTSMEPSTSATGCGVDRRKVYTRPGSRRYTSPADALKSEITVLQQRLAKNVLKTSKVIESLHQYYQQRVEFDPFLSPTEPANPWISDTVDFWQIDAIPGDYSSRRLKLWAMTFDDLLLDSAGRDTLQKFLEKEYSGENLRFWWEVQRLRKCAYRMVPVLVTEIYSDFLSTTAASPVNVDNKVMDITEQNLTDPNRWSFDEAAEHIYKLMKNDSYQRFLRSDIYKELVACSKKKGPKKRFLGGGLQGFMPSPAAPPAESATAL